MRAGSTFLTDTVYIYANTSLNAAGLTEAEEQLGNLVVRNSKFTLRVERDLRGHYISASQFSVYIYNWDDPAPGNSEVGLPVLVE